MDEQQDPRTNVAHSAFFLAADDDVLREGGLGRKVGPGLLRLRKGRLMTAAQTIAPVSAEAIEEALLGFLTERVKTEVEADQDLFASGLVSSMFAMQLVVHLEESYDIAIIGPELKLDNFRTVQAMTALVLRLRDASGAADDA
jgi:methoxymalonate biosynthesis acyl carrier protein